MKRDSEATRRRILEAAVVEFAEHGIAGARVDRIAAAAESNKQLIYQYYGSKEKLFHAVLSRELARAGEGVALTPDDLERYAGAYFDFVMANPRMMRLIAWAGLEVEGPIAGVATAQAKIGLVATAQRDGAVTDRFAPEFIVATITALCVAWVPSNWYANQIHPEGIPGASRYRESIVRLVGMMIRAAPDAACGPEPRDA